MPALTRASRASGPQRGKPRAARPTQVRFPCGHLEGEAAAQQRCHHADQVIWVTCARCNVIVVVVGNG